MEWIVKIENEHNLRISVLYFTLEDKIVFNGEYGVKKNKFTQFHKFVSIEKEIGINLEEIQETLFEVYDELSRKVKIFNEFTEGFDLIKVIEISRD